ncbi:40S ribosomal protein S27 [Microbotryomycetes sp. JL201]|nr:40S ribosomal protein S27 [Microbotryomycetes sp. JL201]
MSDWDASDNEETAAPSAPKVAVAAKKGKFADEDASDDDVKDDWDASDEEAPAAPKSNAPPPPVRQKGITKQKIAEKEAAERARQEAAAQRAAEDDPALRRAREREAQLSADMDNAAALFGQTSVSNGSNDDILSRAPKTEAEFKQLAEDIAEALKKHEKSRHYAKFTEELARAVCLPLKDVDVRKSASALTALANEKQRESKAGGKKTKGSNKPALGAGKSMGQGRADLATYEEVLDDSGEYDDFSGLAVDLLNPSREQEAKTHKLKRLVQSPNSFFMDIKCPGCFTITTVFSHASSVVLCGSCSTVLCQPTGGKARLMEGCSFRRKV